MTAPERHRLQLGVLGGTFDPPHLGHLTLADLSLEQLGLGGVLFVPVGQPPHRSEQTLSEPFHRVAMVSLAIAYRAGYTLSRADLDRAGPHYTADLLGILQQAHPSAGLVFLMGGDSLAQFLTWKDPERIMAQARLAVLDRPGWQADLQDLEGQLPGLTERVVWLRGSLSDISATDIRCRVREGQPISDLVPAAVEDYIRNHSLYLETDAKR